jgi:hypothetical protein
MIVRSHFVVWCGCEWTQLKTEARQVIEAVSQGVIEPMLFSSDAVHMSAPLNIIPSLTSLQ